MDTYVARVCGTAGTEALTRRALAEIDGDVDENTPAARAAATVSRTARAVALGELARVSQAPGYRARRLLARHWRCPHTPTLLRERAASEISRVRLDQLYRHVDVCRHCADTAARCDSAEWYLEAALSESAQPSPVRPPHVPVSARPSPSPALTEPAPPSLESAGDGSVDGRPEPASPTAEIGAAPGPVMWPQPHPARRRLGGGKAVAGGALVVVVAAALVLGLRGGGAVSPTALPPGGVTVHALRAPFVVGGARYAVFFDPAQNWDVFLRTDPGPERRWVALTVRARNLTMTDFDPQQLAYQLVDQQGMAYRPEPSLGTEPAARQPRRPLPAGGLAESHLGFRVPRTARGLLLRFAASPGSPPIWISLTPSA